MTFNKTIDSLLDTGVLNTFQDFKNVFAIIGKNIYTEEEAACTIDPFAFVSHLSAMAYHGLTDRLPRMLFISSPAAVHWHTYATEKMKKDLGKNLPFYQSSKLPGLHRIAFDKIGKKAVNIFSSIHMGAYKSVKNKNLRVATIGRTFLDMVRKPDLCGGIYHVIAVFKEHAALYLKLIIDEFDRHGKNIDKIRAGYIIDELCRINDPGIDAWLAYVARGGSRKLDPAGEYSASYSEKWCLSINVEID